MNVADFREWQGFRSSWRRDELEWVGRRRGLPLRAQRVEGRDVRVVEGARLESVCRGNSTVGSNPTLSAILLRARQSSARASAGWRRRQDSIPPKREARRRTNPTLSATVVPLTRRSLAVRVGCQL